MATWKQIPEEPDAWVFTYGNDLRIVVRSAYRGASMHIAELWLGRRPAAPANTFQIIGCKVVAAQRIALKMSLQQLRQVTAHLETTSGTHTRKAANGTVHRPTAERKLSAIRVWAKGQDFERANLDGLWAILGKRPKQTKGAGDGGRKAAKDGAARKGAGGARGVRKDRGTRKVR